PDVPASAHSSGWEPRRCGSIPAQFFIDRGTVHANVSRGIRRLDDRVGSLRSSRDLQLLTYLNLVRVRDVVRLGDSHVAVAARRPVVLESDVGQRVPRLDGIDDVAVIVGGVKLCGVLDNVEPRVVEGGDSGDGGD